MKNSNIDRAKLLKIINQASFAMDDVKLFLDTHPNCQEAIEYYQKAQKVRNEAWNEYTRKFGPLSAYDVDACDYWDWNKGPMPWEGGDC